MARSIVDAMQENVNPVSVSNALYEMMVEWFTSATMEQAGPTRSQRDKHSRIRGWTENTLSKFFNVSQTEMREMLEQHYGITIPRIKA